MFYVGVLVGFAIAVCLIFGFVVVIASMGSSQESRREEQRIAVPVKPRGIVGGG